MTKVVHDTDIGSGLEISGGKLNAASTMATDAEVAAAIAAADSAENVEESTAKQRTDYLRRAQYHLTTAAMIEIVGESIKFHPDGVYNLSRILLMGAGDGSHSGSDGYFEIAPPPAGTVIKGMGIADSVVDANGFINVPTYGTLYYKLPPAGATGDTQGGWYAARYGQGNYIVPDDFLFVCQQQPNIIGGMFQMFDGRQLFQGKNYTDTGWINLASYFASGVTNYGSGFQSARFRRLNNRVYLEGLINAPSATYTGTLASLPAGFKPVNAHIFVTASAARLVRADVYNSGAIYAMSATGGWISLDGINFDLA